jgi:hypothetical protein
VLFIYIFPAMRLYAVSFLAVVALSGFTTGQFATTTTVLPNGQPVYIPVPGAPTTSSIAAPAATPTLVYNCNQMPLICENVATWAKKQPVNQFPQGANGDIPNNLLFFFDPNASAKESRRRNSCGCFKHDDCPSQTSNGKQAGVAIPNIALGGGPLPLNVAANNIVLAGVNPSPPAPMVPFQSVPGRFYRQGIAYSCDGMYSPSWAFRVI